MGHQGPYSQEFREQILSLYRAGSSVSELAAEFKPCDQTIRNWIRQAEIDEGKRDGVTTEDKEELKRLRRENQKLRQEREILKKATAWFAQETNPTTNSESSNS